MFDFSVSKDMRGEPMKRIPTFLLAVTVKELKNNVEHGRVVTTLFIIIH